MRIWRNIKQAVRFATNIASLTIALAKDRRVPRRTKIILGVAAVYFLSPVDIIPDWIPVLGYLDDAIVAMIVLDLITNCVDPGIVRQHWRGSAATLALAQKMARCCCVFIPKGIKQRILYARNDDDTQGGKDPVAEDGR